MVRVIEEYLNAPSPMYLRLSGRRTGKGPAPDSAAKKAESPEERLIHTVIERVMQLPPEQVEILQGVFESKEEDFTRAMSVLKAMKG